MARAAVLDAAGVVVGTRELPDALFSGEVNPAVLHQVVTAQLAAARSGTASTKTRSEVRGGGHKPWRQKGTGRARHGSIRSPLWTGGGTVFGPKPRTFSQRVNKKMRKAALRAALAARSSEEKVYVLEGFDQTKTRFARTCLDGAGIDGRVLLVLDPASEADQLVDRAFRNLPRVAFSLYGALAAYDVLAADAVVFTTAALQGFCNRDAKETSR